MIAKRRSRELTIARIAEKGEIYPEAGVFRVGAGRGGLPPDPEAPGMGKKREI